MKLIANQCPKEWQAASWRSPHLSSEQFIFNQGCLAWAQLPKDIALPILVSILFSFLS